MKVRAPRNRTLILTEDERQRLAPQLLSPKNNLIAGDLTNRVIHGDLLKILDFLPDAFVDLLFLDPPYNLDKHFGDVKFAHRSNDAYQEYLESWFPRLLRLLKPHATVYLCGDWQCSAAEYQVMAKYLHVQNRITWQREKGRGAKSNWKNCCEDIWFGTLDGKYYFNVEAVKQKRRVIAPYRENGRPKDWEETSEGNYRLTYPSNFWDDISVPYWSMPENTDHPTQKPEKLLAKLILASSRPGDFVFDPFLGSGTTAVVAKKLGRRFCGVELSQEYCCWALKRLEDAEHDTTIQGYHDGVFWERNSLKQPRPPKP
ncbi:MAG: hypothetical protein J5654_10205 [Victivallales bacterium]|nr:hypothetical protein [Victivallales bacterium]